VCQFGIEVMTAGKAGNQLGRGDGIVLQGDLATLRIYLFMITGNDDS
jgi:hypothetical protein